MSPDTPTPRRERPPLGWLLAALAVPALAQPAPEAPGSTSARPDLAGRVVTIFDFEEQGFNPNPVPRYWVRVHDTSAAGSAPSFPSWNKAELRYTSKDPANLAASGEGALVLPTEGGGTRVRLEPGVLPIFPGADYTISASVRTEGLRLARARVSARLLDNQGQPIANTLRHAAPISSPGQWGTTSLEVRGDSPQAAFLQIELELLQPEQYLEEPPRLREQDFRGAAWFDDVRVVQLPRLEIATSAPLNAIAAPDVPEVRVYVRDLTGESLSAQVRVFDVHGREVDRHAVDLPSGLTSTSWKPSLPRLGWYRARLDVLGAAGSVGHEDVDFAWLPALPPGRGVRTGEPGSRDRDRFGVIATTLPFEFHHAFPDLARDLRLGSVTIPVLDRASTPESSLENSRAFVPLVDGLLSQWQDVTFAIARIPEPLALQARCEQNDPWPVLLAGRTLWGPYLEPWMDKYGQRIPTWQIGLPGDDIAFWRDSLPADLREVGGMLARHVAGPVLTVPTLAGRLLPRESFEVAGLPLRTLRVVGDELTPPAVGLAVRALEDQVLSRARDAEQVIALRPSEPGQYAPASAAGELAKRAIEAWAAGGDTPPRLAIVDPWRISSGRRDRLLPRPEAVAWRQLADRLGGRRAVGSLPAGPGIVCYILAPASDAELPLGGALVAWNESAPPESSYLRAYVGAGAITLHDLWGNSSPAPAAEPTPGSSRAVGVRVPLSGDPLFIEGVDVTLTRFLADFRVDPDFIESTADSHEHALLMHNPWPMGIAGRYTIVSPGRFEEGDDRPADSTRRLREWRISPRLGRFSIPAGESARIPFNVTFGPGVEVGAKDFVFELDLDADTQHPTIEVRRRVELGLSSVRLDLASRFEPGAGAEPDAIVEATVTNVSSSPVTLTMTAFAPGHPRQPASIAGLAPGQQVSRRFVYAGAADKLAGQRVSVNLAEPDSKGRLNASVELPRR